MDTVEFTWTLPDGRQVEVIASGKVLPSEYYSAATVQEINVDIYFYDGPLDYTGSDVSHGEIGDPEWNKIEQYAATKLLEDVTFYAHEKEYA